MGQALGESFVLWIDRDAPADVLRGTVEHVASARRERFESLADLARFLRQAWGEPPQPRAGTVPGGPR